MSSLSSIKKGMQKKEDGISSAKERLNALQKLDLLEKFCNQIGQGFKQMSEALNKMNQRLTFVEASVSALIAIEGVDKVKNQVAEDRKKSLEDEGNQHALNVSVALKDGRIVTTDAVAEKTLVAFQDKTLEGEIRFPSQIHMEFEDLDESYRNGLLGKKVGDVVNIGESIITILAIYKSASAPVTEKE